MSRITVLLNSTTGDDDDGNNNDMMIELPDTNAFLRRVLYEQIEVRFSSRVMVKKNEMNKLCVYKMEGKLMVMVIMIVMIVMMVVMIMIVMMMMLMLVKMMMIIMMMMMMKMMVLKVTIIFQLQLPLYLLNIFFQLLSFSRCG